MRRDLVVVALVACGSCKPFVETETYYCGPNRTCPPDQVCDEPTYTCSNESFLVESFACPDGAQDAEPDGTLEQSVGLGETICGELLTSARLACIADEGDVDVYQIEHSTACELNNRALVAINFPAAFVPLKLDILDSSGALVVSGEDCTAANDVSGRFRVCAEVDLEVGDYFVEVAPRLGEGLDCSGGCAYNEYELDVFLPL